MSAKQFKTVEYRLAHLEKFSFAWAEFFHFFSETQDDVDLNLEEEFAEASRQLASQLYPLSELGKGAFDDADKIYKMLRSTPSLEHFKNIGEAEFDKYQVQWHEIYLNLNKARGKLLHRLTPKQREAHDAAAGGQQAAA